MPSNESKFRAAFNCFCFLTVISWQGQCNSSAPFLESMVIPFKDLRGCSIAASDGNIGSAIELLFNDETWSVRYLVVDTGSWLAGGLVLLGRNELGRADPESGTIAVAVSKKELLRAPGIQTVTPVSIQLRKLERERRQALTAPATPPAGRGAPASTSPSANLRQRSDPHLRSSAAIAGTYTFRTHDGEIGTVEDFVLDDEEWRIRYLVARVGLVLFGKKVLVPSDLVRSISAQCKEIGIDLTCSMLKHAHRFRPGEPIPRSLG